MELIINNRKETVEGDNLTLAELIKVKNYTFKMLVTKINGTLVKKNDRETAIVKNGDNVVVLHMVSGG